MMDLIAGLGATVASGVVAWLVARGVSHAVRAPERGRQRR